MQNLPKHLTTSLEQLDQEIQVAKKSLTTTSTPTDDQVTYQDRKASYIQHPDWTMHATTTIHNENAEEAYTVKQDFRLKLENIFEHIVETRSMSTPNADVLSPELTAIVAGALLPQTIGHIDGIKNPTYPTDTIQIMLEKNLLVFNFGQNIAHQTKIVSIDHELWRQQCKIKADIFLALRDIDTTWQWTQDDGLMIHIDARWSPIA